MLLMNSNKIKVVSLITSHINENNYKKYGILKLQEKP